MKEKYAIIIQNIGKTDEAGQDDFRFEVRVHEDLFRILRKISEKPWIAPGDVAAFGLGLKLFSEIVRRNSESAPFASMLPHLNAIMKEVKGSAKRHD